MDSLESLSVGNVDLFVWACTARYKLGRGRNSRVRIQWTSDTKSAANIPCKCYSHLTRSSGALSLSVLRLDPSDILLRLLIPCLR